MKRHFSTYLMTILMLVVLCLTPAAAFAQDANPAYDLRFAGVIDGSPVEAGDPWVIAGYTVNVDEATVVHLTGGTLNDDDLQLTGMWATVIAHRDDAGDLVASQITVARPEIRIKGPITAIPETEGRTGAWVVAGQEIEVTVDTKFNERGGPLAEGGWAEVYASEVGDGLTALRIRSTEFQEEVEIYGVIQAFSAVEWTLSTVDLSVNEETLSTGEPQLGLLAHAAAIVQGDGSLLARNFRVMWQEPGGLHQAVQFRATVVTLPEEDMAGTWKVTRVTAVTGGTEGVEETVEVTVTDATSIIAKKGLIIEGSVVHIVAWEVDGGIQAVQITLVDTDGIWKGKAFYHAGTIQDMPPGNGLMGNWTIGDQQLRVTERTRIEGAQYARVGAPAEAGGVQLQNGVRVLTWLRIREHDGRGTGFFTAATGVVE
ncbi:MAG: hypothetical protein GX616_14345 [Planctomycetes bacterium]|nr:hypothetical protein [Planctomycetota bacterium]